MQKLLYALLITAVLATIAACNKDSGASSQTELPPQESAVTEPSILPPENPEPASSSELHEEPLSDDSEAADFGMGLDADDKRTMKAGDTIGEWKLSDLQISYDDDDNIHILDAVFVGNIKLKGMITPSVLVADGYDFRVSTEDEGRMPCYISPETTRKDEFWFMLTIPEDLAATLELTPDVQTPCQITVSEYRYTFAYMTAPAVATVVDIEL